jgi:hypothetical protein
MPSEAELELIETLRPRTKSTATTTIKVKLNRADCRALSAAARARGMMPKGLARKLLHVVLHDRLIDAVLDEDGEP